VSVGFMMDNYSGPERRKNRRVKADFVVIYRVNHPLQLRMMIGHHDVNAVMLDLSASGIALLTSYNIPASSLLSMRFTLINESAAVDQEKITHIKVNGEVRSNRPWPRGECRLGICFTGISESDRSKISEFVKIVNQPGAVS